MKLKESGSTYNYEIKSTGKEGVNEKFERYFFSISTAELLTAQDLKAKYSFPVCYTKTGEKMELTLKEVLSRAKGSIQLGAYSFESSKIFTANHAKYANGISFACSCSSQFNSRLKQL